MIKLDPSTSLDDLTFAFLDVETTGLSPHYGDRVCEIAVVRSRTDLIQATYATLVNPQRPISLGASAVNGLTDDDVRDAPLFSKIIESLVEMFRDAVIVCHNAPFDLGFVSSEMLRARRAFPIPTTIDTLMLARANYRFRSNSLSNIARVLEIPTPDSHRALGDVMTTRAVLNRFIEDFGKTGRRTLGELLELQGGDSFVMTAAEVEPLPTEIAEAFLSGKRLFLVYVDARGEKSERWVTPQRIVGAEDTLTLVAHCHLRDERRQFRLDRIVRMDVEN